MKAIKILLSALYVAVAPGPALGQVPAPVQQAAPAPLPAATKLEGFKPVRGSVTTLGYDELGRINPSFTASGLVLVEIRQLQAGGDAVQGMTVTITESQYREEMAFVDGDEMRDLVRGIDALIDLKANPTKFRSFEVRYATKGDLVLIAFNNAKNEVQYAIQAGRILKAKRFLSLADFRKFRAMLQVAADRLTPTG